MNAPRRFAVCQSCGSWKEICDDVLAFFADYDMRFFIEQHISKCPHSGKFSPVISVSEDDPGFQPLSPSKKWQPISCPGYRPQQRPKWFRYSDNIAGRLLGIWVEENDNCLVMLPDGEGILEYWNYTFCGYRRFRWRLEGDDHLCFGNPHDSPIQNADCPDVAANHLGTYRAYFELILFTNLYGEQNDRLCIYTDDITSDPREFYRSMRSIEDYQIPKFPDA